MKKKINESLVDDTVDKLFENPNFSIDPSKVVTLTEKIRGFKVGDINSNSNFADPNLIAPETLNIPSVVKSVPFSEKFQNSTFGKNYGAWNAGLSFANNLAGGILGPKSEYSGDKGSLTQGLDTAYDTISDAIAMVPGWGQAASLIMKGGSLLGKFTNKFGGGTDGMTSTDAILGSSFLNLTPIGLINGFGGKKTQSFSKDNQLFETMGASYGDTNALTNEALTKSNKKYGTFSSGARKRANSLISEAKRQLSILSGINDYTLNMLNVREGMYSTNELNRQYNLQGAYDLTSIRAAKQGMKIELEELPEFAEIQIDWEYEDVSKFQKGGKINIIPEGAFHSRLHHMNIEGITKKGIPVISEEEGGKIELHAEIEHSEIIYRIEVTEKIEELANKYNSDKYTLEEKDEFAIEAGKLIVKETLYNTDDRVGLIDKTRL